MSSLWGERVNKWCNCTGAQIKTKNSSRLHKVEAVMLSHSQKHCCGWLLIGFHAFANKRLKSAVSQKWSLHHNQPVYPTLSEVTLQEYEHHWDLWLKWLKSTIKQKTLELPLWEGKTLSASNPDSEELQNIFCGCVWGREQRETM